jgi:hypothetical protein
VVAAALPAAALVLGWMALREVETKPNVGGRSLAATGATTALAAVLWTLSVAVLLVAKQAQG